MILSVEHLVFLKNQRKDLASCTRKYNSIGKSKERIHVRNIRRVIDLINVACRFLSSYTEQRKKTCYDELLVLVMKCSTSFSHSIGVLKANL